jgi:hypothetical protein
MAFDYIVHLTAGEWVGDVLLVPGEEEPEAGNRSSADMCGVEDLGLGERSEELPKGRHQLVQLGRAGDADGGYGGGGVAKA